MTSYHFNKVRNKVEPFFALDFDLTEVIIDAHFFLCKFAADNYYPKQ